MNKENVLFGIVGLLAGMIIGFMVTNSINKGNIGGGAPVADLKLNSNMPPGHPEVAPGQTAPGTTTAPGAMTAEVQAAIDKAKQSPDDFDAQVKAADMYNAIDRFDDAIPLLKRANQLKPDDREVIVHLGNACFDGNHFDEAEKWYMAALAKKADDVSVRTDLGLTFVFREPPDYDRAIQEFNKSLETDPNHVQTLQNLTVAYTKKGDAAKATSTLAKLESIDPKNTAVPKLREDVQKMNVK
ncbi:MAG: tetratricopeptide repeat protein [Acidobacteriota bacterium]